jgi:hypothetical protein
MADQDRPNQNANKDKAEGERWSPEEPAVENAARDENPAELYEEGKDSDNAGGITNRPLDEEVGNQEGLPDRGTNRDSRGNPDATRREGDDAKDQR